MDKQLQYIVRRALNSMHDSHHDTDSGWNRIKKRCTPRQKNSLLSRITKYAAVVVLFISVGTYVWFSLPNKNEPNDTTVLAHRNTGVELLLANGKKIKLEQSQEDITVEDLGMRITRDSVNGTIAYQMDSLANQRSLMFNQLNVPKGGEYTLTLSDGSVVRMNSESTLKFPVTFANNRREVYLEGEAFFEIVKNQNAPFIVCTGNKKVTVLGTHFNISAYPDDLLWQTTLVQGKVSVQAGETEKILSPSQQCSINNQTGQLVVNTVETGLYTSWMDGKFHFKGYRFEDIVKKMERWYDFEMIYQQEEIKNMYFRGVINKDRPLEETLRYLEATTNIAFDIHGKTITVRKTDK